MGERLIADIPPHPVYVRLLGTEAKMTCPAGIANSSEELRRLVLSDVVEHVKYLCVKQNVRRRDRHIIRPRY